MYQSNRFFSFSYSDNISNTITLDIVNKNTQNKILVNQDSKNI